MDNNSPGTQDSHANPSGPREEVTMTDTASITEHASPSQPEGEEHPEVQVTMDYLRSLLDVPLLDPSRLQKTPSKFPEVVQVVPEGFHKIRFEINAEFPKNTPKIDRILSIFDVARRYDKSVCLCPSGKEPHPVLYTPTDIKQSRFHRYFQDKPGAKSTRHDDRTTHMKCVEYYRRQTQYTCQQHVVTWGMKLSFERSGSYQEERRFLHLIIGHVQWWKADRMILDADGGATPPFKVETNHV